jgi:uncharacterized protein
MKSLLWIWVYILAIVAAEVLGVTVDAALGFSAHALIVLALLVNYVWNESAPYRRMLPALMLVPLLRILSLALPSPAIPQIYWYLLVGVPVLLAAALAARLLQIPAARLGLNARFILVQVVIALTGLPLALAAYLVLRPEPVVSGSNWLLLAIGAGILVVFAGFTEEFIFRGLVLQTTREVFGAQAAIIASSVLFAALYVGSLSLGFLILIGLVGVYFAVCVEKTGSLLGVTVAHSVMAIGLILVLPALVQAFA